VGARGQRLNGRWQQRRDDDSDQEEHGNTLEQRRKAVGHENPSR
jgi:hypothetical protein